MDPTLRGDRAGIEEVLTRTAAEAARVLAAIDERPAAVDPGPHAPEPVPVDGAGFDGALRAFLDRYAGRMSGSAGPRYLGFVTGGVTPAALAGDWLTSTFDNNVISSLDSAASLLEREAIGWLVEALGLDGFTGAFVSGATMSNVVGLACAREWVAERHGRSVADDGLHAIPPVAVLSGSAHSSAHKALAILGMGRSSLVSVDPIAGREAVDVAALAGALEAQDGAPAIVIANSGTVNSVDFDDLEAIAALRERFPFWLHVDGAFGAFARLCPEHEHLVAGLELADSVCVDAHKWLNVPYDSAMQFTRRQDLQTRVFQNLAIYVGLPGDDPDFVHLTPESSRRLRALPAWLALKAYGIRGHREIVERTTRLARALGERIRASDRFELVGDVRLNVACFTLTPDGSQEAVTRFVRALRDGGGAFMTPTDLFGRPTIRAAFANWRTTEDDLEVIWRAMLAAATEPGASG